VLTGRAVLGAVVVLAAAWLSGCTPPPSSVPVADPTASAGMSRQVAAARAMLAQVRIGGRGAKTGYERTVRFGTGWIDVDGNGCDTRNDILGRDLTETGRQSECEVSAGILNDPYTGRRIDFGTRRSAVQIDHVVPLSLAWQLGAAQWEQQDRVRFANDPANLLAVDASANQQKRDSGPDSWLPPDSSYRCTYVIRFTRIISGYALRLTSSMRNAISTELDRCGDVRGKPASLVLLPSIASLFFADCAAVRAAGQAPLRSDEPGYRPALDRDGDGYACD
jgi:hypothetical protein